MITFILLERRRMSQLQNLAMTVSKNDFELESNYICPDLQFYVVKYFFYFIADIFADIRSSNMTQYTLRTMFML